jgi:hypothetical protein
MPYKPDASRQHTAMAEVTFEDMGGKYDANITMWMDAPNGLCKLEYKAAGGGRAVAVASHRDVTSGAKPCWYWRDEG